MTLGKKTSRRALLRGAVASGMSTALAGAFASGDPAVSKQISSAPHGRIREYWISADNTSRNLVPTGYDQLMGVTYDSSATSFTGISYFAYTENWGEVLPGNDDIGPNTGVPGPIIRAQVGDTVIVHFRNNDQAYGWPHSMHFHGFRYAPPSDGAYIYANGFTPGTAVRPGDTYDYVLTAMETSVGTWVYHDHSLPESISLFRRIAPGGGAVKKPGMQPADDGDGNNPTSVELCSEIGMVGISAITSPHEIPPDREFVVFLQDLYAADIPSLGQDFDCVNGFSFLGNTPTFTAMVGEKVRWRVGVLGTEFHVFHIHGHRWLQGTNYVDSVVMGPSTTLTIDFVEDNPGNWLFHCHVPDHMMGGMVGKYVVLQPNQVGSPTGPVPH